MIYTVEFAPELKGSYRLDTHEVNGLLFSSSEQLQYFFEREMIHSRQDKEIRLSKSGYDIKLGHTLMQNLKARKTNSEMSLFFQQRFPELAAQMLLEEMTPYQIALTRLLYNCEGSRIVYIDSLYEQLTDAEIQLLNRQILFLQNKYALIFVHLFTDITHGRYCQKLVKINPQNSSLILVKYERDGKNEK